MEQAPKTPAATPPKSKKTMYAVVGAIVIIIVIVAALYLAGIFGGTSTPPANASAKIYDTGICSTSSDCGFTPTPLNIVANTKVTWTSNSSTTHTVTECVSSSTSCPNFDSSALSPAFDSGSSNLIASGGSYSYTFKTAGTYYYYCQIHSWMHGQVVVS